MKEPHEVQCHLCSFEYQRHGWLNPTTLNKIDRSVVKIGNTSLYFCDLKKNQDLCWIEWCEKVIVEIWNVILIAVRLHAPPRAICLDQLIKVDLFLTYYSNKCQTKCSSSYQISLCSLFLIIQFRAYWSRSRINDHCLCICRTFAVLV